MSTKVVEIMDATRRDGLDLVTERFVLHHQYPQLASVTWRGKGLGVIFTDAHGRLNIQAFEAETRQVVCCRFCAAFKLLDIHTDKQLATLSFEGGDPCQG